MKISQLLAESYLKWHLRPDVIQTLDSCDQPEDSKIKFDRMIDLLNQKYKLSLDWEDSGYTQTSPPGAIRGVLLLIYRSSQLCVVIKETRWLDRVHGSYFWQGIFVNDPEVKQDVNRILKEIE